MKTITVLFSTAFIFLLASCSPSIVTNIAKTYPDVIYADSVIVFEFGEKIPSTAEVLGNVAVVDKGAATNCRYEQVVALAKNETAKIGGNGLAIIEHYPPSFWGSSCHQITGIMLHLTDMEIDENSNVLQDMIAANNEFIEQESRKKLLPKNTLTASIGYGIITSKIYTPTSTYDSKGGLDWRIQYERIYNNGMGFGLLYSGFKTTFPEYKETFPGFDGNVMLSYFAPCYIVGFRSNAWIMKFGIGVGYFHYNEKFYSTGGVGFNYDLGVEYMLSESIGLGFSVNGISSSLKQDYDLPNNEKHGINRISFLGGLRLYF